MRQISKATLAILSALGGVFEAMVVVSISGNTCTDKKAAAINMIEGGYLH
jgi:hydroxymethylglutaryl-CoA reductase